MYSMVISEQTELLLYHVTHICFNWLYVCCVLLKVTRHPLSNGVVLFWLAITSSTQGKKWPSKGQTLDKGERTDISYASRGISVSMFLGLHGNMPTKGAYMWLCVCVCARMHVHLYNFINVFHRNNCFGETYPHDLISLVDCCTLAGRIKALELPPKLFSQYRWTTLQLTFDQYSFSSSISNIFLLPLNWNKHINKPQTY